MLSKGDICKMLESVGALQSRKYDTALPQQWVDKMDELGVDARASFVWDYSVDRVYGKPLNVCALFVEHFGQQTKSSNYLKKKDSHA